MLCAPFIMYSFLPIPAVDGSNCAQLEMAMTIFAVVSFIIALCCAAGQTPKHLLLAAFFVLTAPFFLYIAPAVILWIMVYNLMPRKKTKDKNLPKQSKFMDEIRIDPKSAQIIKEEEKEEEINEPRTP